MINNVNAYILLPIIGFLLWVVVLCVHIVAVIHAKCHLYSWRKKRDVSKVPVSEIGVSIIKTMTASTSNTMLNSNALYNLEALFKLDYPLFEILICLPDKENDLVGQIENIMAKYSYVDAKLYTNACQDGVNPKVNNMLQCYDQARYEYLWICDSNIFVNEWSLTELISHVNANVGMVHQLPYCKAGRYGFSNCLDKIYFGMQHARWYMFFDFFGICCTNGMSSLINKTYLDQTGGLKVFSCYIAEDHFIGKSFYDRGLKIVLSTEPALQNPDVSSVSHFVNRITRWQKLRITMVPTSVFEPLVECFLIGLIGSYSINNLFSIPIMRTYLFHICYWFLMDQMLIWIIEGSYSSLPSIWHRTSTWLFRESVTYWVYIKAMWNRKINWRMGTFDIKYGGKASFIEAQEKFA